MTDLETEARVPYKASEMNESLEKEIERLRGQVMWSWEKEARNLGWFGLHDGMSILELGSGPGFVTDWVTAATGFSSIGEQLWVQAKAVGLTIVWSGIVAFVAFKLVDLTIGLRVAEEDEREGLDTASHGEAAYRM